MSTRRSGGIRLVALAAVLSSYLAGCSGGATGDRRAEVQRGSSDCDFKGITAGPRHEGSCVAHGVAVTVADKAHWLHGADYDVRVLDVRVDGTEVTVDLAMRNTLTQPHWFDRDSNLVFMYVAKRYFAERPALEDDLTTDPFRHRPAAVQPGAAVTSSVSFALPAALVPRLDAMGSNLIFLGYADAAKGFPTGTQPLKTLGYIRLWK